LSGAVVILKQRAGKKQRGRACQTQVKSPGAARWMISLGVGLGLAAGIGLGFLIILYGENEPARLKVEVLEVRPHDARAFTQGLLLDDSGRMFESTGLYGASSLREVASASGEVLRKIDIPRQYFAEGLALVDDRLIQLTWKENTAFVYDKETFDQVGTFNYTTQGWGLTYDGVRLIMSDGSNKLYFRNPDTFDLEDSVSVMDGDMPVTHLNELEYVDGFVYANIWMTDRIVRIDPKTGRVTATIDASGLLSPPERQQVDVLNGIACNSETGNFYITGKYWPKLFVVNFVPVE
jgi:glutaminyl-peptide cyclotransferase